MNDPKDSKDKSGLVAGIILGAAAGAGIAFLFGTKKGKEFRKKIRDDYPEVFDKLEEVVSGTQDSLKGSYSALEEHTGKLRKGAGQIGSEVRGRIVERISKLTSGEKSGGRKNAPKA